MEKDKSTEENSILILAPTGQDGALTARVLERAGVKSVICTDQADLCAHLERVYGALIIAEEALTTSGLETLNQVLSQQPTWSDLPVILLTGGGTVDYSIVRALDHFAAAGNVTLLDRPLKTQTIVSATLVALRARRRQYRVRTLLEEQKTATELRDEFISVASHELKNPLTTLKLQLQLNERFLSNLDSDMVPASRVYKLVETTKRIAERLTRLIDDMLDSARIQTGKLNFRFEDTSLSAWIEESLERQLPKIAESGNLLSIDIQPDVQIKFDPIRIEQVLGNLISNAQRYAPRSVLKCSLKNVGNAVRIEFEDGGPGIAPDHLEKIFDRFERANQENRSPGLGLGLYICREIIRGHGGEMWVESEPGKGAKFIIEIPTFAGLTISTPDQSNPAPAKHSNSN